MLYSVHNNSSARKRRLEEEEEITEKDFKSLKRFAYYTLDSIYPSWDNGFAPILVAMGCDSARIVEHIVEFQPGRSNIVMQQVHKCNLLRKACHGQCKNRFINQLIQESTELQQIIESLIKNEIPNIPSSLSVFTTRSPAFVLPFLKALNYYVHWLKEIRNVTHLSDFHIFMEIIENNASRQPYCFWNGFFKGLLENTIFIDFMSNNKYRELLIQKLITPMKYKNIMKWVLEKYREKPDNIDDDDIALEFFRIANIVVAPDYTDLMSQKWKPRESSFFSGYNDIPMIRTKDYSVIEKNTHAIRQRIEEETLATWSA